VAVEENNLGVAYLEAGDLRNALQRFSDALKYTTATLAPGPNPQRDAEDELDLTVCCGSYIPPFCQEYCGPPPESTGPKSRDNPATHEKTQTVPASVPFAYARGINLIPCATAYSPDPLINTTIVSSIIIFNVSIIYHLKGLEGRTMGSTRLQKAKSLYQKSHHLLVDAGVPLGSTGNPVIDMLSMALFNNLAHVAFEMQGYEDSRKYFDSLIRFALTVVPTRYGDAYVGSLLDQQKSNFLLNAIILQAPKLAAAA
jgi:tetratricopeptide (TPR) repeat protein